MLQASVSHKAEWNVSRVSKWHEPLIFNHASGISGVCNPLYLPFLDMTGPILPHTVQPCWQTSLRIDSS